MFTRYLVFAKKSDKGFTYILAYVILTTAQ